MRILAFGCLAAHAVEAVELSESVSLLQTGVSKKKQGPEMTPLVLGPPWAKVDAAAFNALKSEGMAMLNRVALELDLTDKEAEGDLLVDGLRFSLAGKHEEEDVDLLITATTMKEARAALRADPESGVQKYNSGRIKASKGETNGLYRGFARVYVAADTTQRFKLSVVKAGTTEPLKIPLLALTFFSLGGGGKTANKNPTTVSDCNTDVVSEFWTGTNVKNETGGGCGGVSFTGTGSLKGKGNSDPSSVAEVGDEDCHNSLVLKWFDAKEIALDFTVGGPSSKKGLYFMFKVGMTQCDATWVPPPTKAELKAAKAAQKAEDKAAKDALKAEANAKKAAAKAIKDAEKAAKAAAKAAR